jgi:pimeloyl-ACP methyl ester carboxylesterase
MADDVAGLCRALSIDGAMFSGFSDGANISLELAMGHASLVRAAVLHGCIVEFTDAYYDGIAKFLGAAGPRDPADPDAMAERHPKYVDMLRRWHAAQGPEHWREVVRLIDPLFTTPLGYVDSDYATATRPLLVLTGDRDPFVTVEEQCELYRRLPDAELAVMAGVGHAFPSDRSFYVNLVEEFLRRRSTVS